ncbi:hypothetical protein [Parasutterella sp.]|uniref:hypothetical protein n=1 Tax=Parasutterella sp. TaxID=2049037 RepID=UPI00206721A9|nr:MAG TPA: hypothetical protein [Caudoviricetes sp.]
MMFSAAAMVRDNEGRTFYEYPEAFTTSQLVFFPVLTEDELRLYQADAIVREGIEELPERRPHVPTVLFSFSDDPMKLKTHFIEGKNVLIDFLDVDDTPQLRETLTRWMRAIPVLRPKSVVVTVMFKNRQLIAWKYDDVNKKYYRFA